MISQDQMRINEKNEKSYYVRDTMNYLFTSNHPAAFYLNDNDRRYFVHEVTAEKPLPDEFYTEYGVWLNGEGPAALLHYFLNLDMGDFNPAAKALRTEARKQMIRAGGSHLENWVSDLKTNPDDVLVVGGKPMTGDLFNCQQLLSAYMAYAGLANAPAPKSFGAALTKGGFKQVHDGKMVSLKLPAKSDRYYAIRNADKWLKASLAELQEHIQQNWQ